MKVAESDKVRVDGIEVGPQAPRTVMLNKPTGTITTTDDPQGRPTVVDLVETEERLYPVGRLDFDTSGILILTNDGDLAHRLMHPSFHVDKTYRALVDGRVKTGVARKLADGIELEDGMTHPAEVRVVQAMNDRSIVELTIHEGRNRQVRRMLDAVGHPVRELVRIAYGPLTVGDLARGKWRDLSRPEIRRLYKAAGMAPSRHRDREGDEDTD
jgi:23S rRNA pseudouridine2605 synthase